MKLSRKTAIQSLMFAAPIVLSSTIGISPSRAVSVARTSGSLILENFTWQGDSVLTNTDTFTEAIAAPGSIAGADADADAIATPEALEQFSTADAAGLGSNYSAIARGTSATGIGFDTQCGCFRFDFSAALDAIAQATEPGEIASANSFVAFYIFKTNDLKNPIDFFKASLSANNPFNLVRSSDFINIDSLDEEIGSVAIDGYYQRQFDQGTQLTVQGFTRSEAVATVPEPPMFAALVILPGLMWLKRRSRQKALPQELTNRQSD